MSLDLRARLEAEGLGGDVLERVLARLGHATGVVRGCTSGAPHVCVDEWCSWMRARGLSAATLRIRSGNVGCAARHAGVGPCELEGDQLVAFLDRDMAAWSRSTYVTSLRARGQWLATTGRRTHDPAAGMPRPKAPRGVPRPTTEADLEQLIAGGRRAGAADGPTRCIRRSAGARNREDPRRGRD